MDEERVNYLWKTALIDNLFDKESTALIYDIKKGAFLNSVTPDKIYAKNRHEARSYPFKQIVHISYNINYKNSGDECQLVPMPNIIRDSP